MASRPRKRRAEDQLSPYSKPVEDVQEKQMQKPSHPNRQKIRRKISREFNPKGLFDDITVKPQVQNTKTNDKVAGLNQCFLKSLKLVLEKESNKDLTYLLKQYSSHLEEIKKNEK